MVINNSTLATNIWTEVKAKIVAGTSGVDIRGSYNDQNPSKSQVVIDPAIIRRSLDKFGGDSNKAITVVIECYASTPKLADELRDEVSTIIEADDIVGIDLKEIDEDWAFTDPGDNKFNSVALSCLYSKD